MDAPKRDWKTLIAESNGSLIAAPEKFIEQIKAWNESRLELNKLANAAAKHELKTRLMLENTIGEIRAYLEENGIKDAYLNDVGFEVNALADGEYVITNSPAR